MALERFDDEIGFVFADGQSGTMTVEEMAGRFCMRNVSLPLPPRRSVVREVVEVELGRELLLLLLLPPTMTSLPEESVPLLMPWRAGKYKDVF